MHTTNVVKPEYSGCVRRTCTPRQAYLTYWAFEIILAQLMVLPGNLQNLTQAMHWAVSFAHVDFPDVADAGDLTIFVISDYGSRRELVFSHSLGELRHSNVDFLIPPFSFVSRDRLL